MLHLLCQPCVAAGAAAAVTVIVQAAYDKLLFREALKVAAYDLGNARDVYRFACGPDGMNRALVQRYIEVSALLLAPITPHTSEHIWGSLLQKSGSVLKAGWPQAAEPDFIMQRAAQYIEGECRDSFAGLGGGLPCPTAQVCSRWGGSLT